MHGTDEKGKKKLGKPEGKKPLGRPKRSGRVILECILGKQGGRVWTGFICLRIATSDRSL
jgi:hypothetical protein